MSLPSRSLECPRPLDRPPCVLLAHGGGGRLMHDLIRDLFARTFRNPVLDQAHDAAVLPAEPHRLAFTTDGYVVKPLEFPGGDLGSLAVHGTLNDLAMSGARPRYLSASFILEEGLPLETLERLVNSMQRAAQAQGVAIVTGDTKVVDQGNGDGVFITTTGLGCLEHALSIGPREIQPGDAILVSGDLGRHGMAIMAVREGLAFESAIESDSACVVPLVLDLLAAGLTPHCLRDLTRGGLTSALNEIAETRELTVSVEEARVPVRPDVQSACEILGLDPFQVACEGRFVLFLPANQAERALEILRRHAVGENAARVGEVLDVAEPRVILLNRLGSRRVLLMSSGEQLPRIC